MSVGKRMEMAWKADMELRKSKLKRAKGKPGNKILRKMQREEAKRIIREIRLGLI
jgi:hypothetical protein